MFKKIILLFVLFNIMFFSSALSVKASDEESSLSGGEIKAMTVQEVANFYKISAYDYSKKLGDLLKTSVKESDSIQKLHDNLGLEPSAAKEIAESLVEGSDVSADDVISKKTQEKTDEIANPKQNYYFLEITFGIIFFYTLTWILAKFEKIKLLTHRKIWNWFLLVTFIPAGLIGLLIALKTVYGIGFNFPFSINYWHTVGGIAMAEISILHIIWHLKYFTIAFKLNK